MQTDTERERRKAMSDIFYYSWGSVGIYSQILAIFCAKKLRSLPDTVRISHSATFWRSQRTPRL